MLTKVGKLLEEDKRQAVEKAVEKAEAEAEEKTKQSIIKMIAKNYPLEEIASIFTSLSLKEIEEIQKETTAAE